MVFTTWGLPRSPIIEMDFRTARPPRLDLAELTGAKRKLSKAQITNPAFPQSQVPPLHRKPSIRIEFDTTCESRPIQ